MNITIYHKINEGDLYPPCSVTMHLSDLVKQHFNDVPSSLEQAEEWLTAELQGDTSLSFPPAPKKIPVRMTPAAKYTAIKRDTFPVVLPLDSINRTPVERYYNAIIIWEGYRIVETLLRNAASREDDDLTRDEVKETLKQLQRVSGAAFEINDKKIHPALNIRYDEVPPEDVDAYDMVYRIYRFLWQYTCKLYYEIGIMFDAVLKPEDVDPVRDFCNDVLEMFPKEYHLESYVDEMKSIHAAQQAVIADEADTSLLAPLYSCKHASLSSLKPTISLVEDSLYSSAIDDEDYSFKSIKDRISDEIIALSDGREILRYVESEIGTLTDLGITGKSTDSVASQVLAFLKEQKEIYKQNISQSFAPISSPLSRSAGKTIPVKLTKSDMNKNKQKARKRFLHFSGYNLQDEKIMSDENFTRLMTYIEYLVEHNATPPNVQQIPTINLSNEHIEHTFYLTHKELYTMRPTRDEWITFIKDVFFQFRDREFRTIKCKWQKPSTYDRDVQQMVDLSKKK
ncbi:MAG: hypothetical protein SPJ43_02905 [Candidatus Cryptobacteroides sp.]|nr:hypothetical protein [Candidatus Cryptobacteroides sp.]